MLSLQIAVIAGLAAETHGWKRKSISHTPKSTHTLFKQRSFLGQISLILSNSVLVLGDQHKLPSL